MTNNISDSEIMCNKILIQYYLSCCFSCASLILAEPFKKTPRGTIFLLHGYNDHTGILKNLICFCLNQNYSVAVYDLPGLGLSSGEQGAIKDFSEYADILKTFFPFIKILCQNHFI